MLSTSRIKAMVAVGGLLSAAVVLMADKQSVYSPTEKAYYADQATVDFVRPGLVFTITKAQIAEDGTVTASVKITDPKGGGLDRLGVATPGTISASFLIGYIPADGTQYTSYITRQRTGTAGTVTQATGENTGTWTALGNGEYTYKFFNKLPAGYDKTATHTIGMYGSRNLSEFSLSTSYADTVLNFVPSGAAVTKVRDVIRTASCNKCHDGLGLHGGSRRSMEICNMCHTPQTPDSASGVTTDMRVMIHKIHFAPNLPSVKAGTPYKVAGHDYSDVVNPAPAAACQVCHEDKAVTGATQSAQWNTKPSRAACGSCHDDVNFATGVNHVNLPQFSDKECSNCHQPKGEADFDASIMGAHTVGVNSTLLAGVVFKILDVADAKPGSKPIVTFTVSDKKGNPVDVKTLNSARVYMGGPTTDINSYVREDVLKAVGPGDGRHFWTFAAAIPADAKGTWQFGMEGYRTTVVLKGTTKERSIRDYAINPPLFNVSVDGSKAVARRATVSTAACNKCHMSISFHGGNRNTIEQCTFCHNPNLATAATATEPALSWNFANMIHRYHEEVRYPGHLKNCAQCHINNGQFPTTKPGTLLVKNPAALTGAPVPVNTNACTTCHNTPEAWSHAVANTSTLGESCNVCHGVNGDFSVAKVHAQ